MSTPVDMPTSEPVGVDNGEVDIVTTEPKLGDIVKQPVTEELVNEEDKSKKGPEGGSSGYHINLLKVNAYNLVKCLIIN